jgi:TolB-like protein/tetratricopeptide (TPR) repeat protein
LPFVNSSGNPDDDYFADGMTDELISSLGRIPGLRVAARSSAFTFKGQKAEVREVARKLNVDSVVEGSVRRSGKRLRVTASLVSAADGLQMWSSTFENDGSDPFGVQDEVTRGVMSGLSLQLSAAAMAASQAGRTKDPEAHDLYLRALQAQNLASEGDLRRALEFYQQAISRDPEFALAYAGIAAVHIFMADAYVAPIDAYPKAKAAAEAALAHDSQLADAYAAKAFAAFSTDWNWAAADRDFSRAMELNPNSVNSLLFRGTYLYFSGRPEQGRADIDRAARLDPLSPLAPFFQEFGSYINGRYRDVIELHGKTQAIDPSFAYIDSWVGGAYRELGDYQSALREYAAAEKLLHGAPQYGLALTYARLGRDRDARDVMQRLDQHAVTHYVPYYLRTAVHAVLGDMDTAVQLLQQAVDTREVIVFAFRQTPEMSSLLKDPRALKIYEQADAIRKTSSQKP